MTRARMPWWLWAAALLPRLFLCVLAACDPSLALRADSFEYLASAHNLAAHGVFSANAAAPFVPDVLRTPGYPLFLAPLDALFGSPVLPAIVLQALMGALTVRLAWGWMERLGGARAAAWAALMLALDPATVLHTPLIMSEALFLLLVTAGGLATARALEDPRPRWAAAAGALWGLSIFVRPISLYLPIPLAWAWRREKRSLAVFLVCAYLLPAAWTLRNEGLTGRRVYSTIAGYDLLRYPAAGVEGLRTGRPWVELQTELMARVDAAHPEGFPNEAVKAQEYGRAALKIVFAHPLLLTRFCAEGAVKVLAGTGLEMFLEWGKVQTQAQADGAFRPQVSGGGTLALLRAHPGLIPLEAAYAAALAALYGFALLGLVRLWRAGRREEAALLAGVALYFLGLSSSQGYYRFRLPMMPFLAVAAAAAATAPRPREKS